MIDGVLFIYHYPVRKSAQTLLEHIFSFERYSKQKYWYVNTEFGFPPALNDLRFKVVLLHFTLFGSQEYKLSKLFLEYLEKCSESYKIVFFQDEYYYCQQRFAFLDKYKIDCIYSLLDPRYYKDVYYKYTKIRNIKYTIPGYVGDDILNASTNYYKPDGNRKLDIGYRGRRLPFFTGLGAQEKSQIAIEFKNRAAEIGLKIDIEINESERLYGILWYKFMANCKACLGVEAGVSIFDLEDKVRIECDAVLNENPNVTFDEIYKRVLYKYENKIPHRVISPRHFEAAAFKVCQILYEGYYSGILQPMVHYIPLKKDFSNFDEVIRLFKDREFRLQIAENAYRDLIASGQYHYQHFIQEFDEELEKHVQLSPIPKRKAAQVTRKVNSRLFLRQLPLYLKYFLFKDFKGRDTLITIVRPFLKPLWEIYRARKAKAQQSSPFYRP